VLNFEASFVNESPFTTVYVIACGGAVFVVLTVTPGEGDDVDVVLAASTGAANGVGADEIEAGITGPEAVELGAVNVVCAGRGASASDRATMETIGIINCRFFMATVRVSVDGGRSVEIPGRNYLEVEGAGGTLITVPIWSFRTCLFVR
jgi:hypothetical protein